MKNTQSNSLQTHMFYIWFIEQSSAPPPISSFPLAAFPFPTRIAHGNNVLMQVCLLYIIRRGFKQMKKQNSGNELSNFHLQLFSLEEQEAAIQGEAARDTRSCLYRIQPLPISISITASFTYFALFLIWFILLLDSYSRAYALAFALPPPFIHSITSVLFGIRVLGYVINGGLLGTMVVTLGFHEEREGSGLIYFLWYMGSRVFPYTRYLMEGLLLLTSYFAFVLQTDPLTILLFLFAVLLSLYYTVFLQNITLRKDEFCCKSLEYSLLFRLCLVSSLAICIITGGQASSSGQLAGCVVGHLLLSALLVGCYFSFGLTIYRHSVARLSLFGMVSLYFCLGVAFLFDLLATSYYSYSTSNLPLIGGVVVLVGEFFFLSMLDGVRRDSNHPSCKDLRQKVFFSFNKYEMADEDEQIDCEIRGVMHEHYTRGCRNPECIVNLKECYDSKKKKKCAITKIAQGKVSVIKFFVKCLYQTALSEQPDDPHLQLDYLQFYYLKLKNVFTTLLRISQLELRYLNFHQRLRLTRLKDYLTTESNEFSRDLYSRNLSMCNIIRSEETFFRIQQLIDVVLERNELFWRYLSFNEVHLREIIKIVEPNFRLLDTISAQWTMINHYFSINRRWKFYFICFTVFVRNEKVKPAAIEDFGNSVEYDSIFRTDNYFVDKTTEKELLYNPIMLFEQNTCYLHARCDEEKMVITRVSNFFQRNLDYEPQEIINSSVTQLMPPSVRNFHHPMFLTWVKEARSSNEAFYEIKKIYPLTKRGYLYPCFKFYKRFIQTTGEVEYIAMLKSNRQDEQLMLLNGDYEVEAITLSLHHKLRLRQGDYLYLKGINLLALMPMLAKYTRLSSQIKEDDEDFLENDDNQNYFKRQGTIVKGRGDEGEQMDVLHERKLLNLANIKVFLPNDFQTTLDFYKQLTTVRKLSAFDAIRELYHWIRREKNFSKFKAEICIRQREMLGHRYYEVQVNELQQNNRLQKLRMGEGEGQQGAQESRGELQQNRLNEIDMQLFFSMSKKKNKVILFPSKNIFLKDENNRALLNIAHIDNINIFIRLSLLLFLSLVLAELMVELNKLPVFTALTNQYYQLSRYEKVAFMLNSQYNIQHLQPGNSWEESFIIIAYTHTLFANYASDYFQALIYDSTLNKPGHYHPYYPLLPTNLTDKPQPSFDQFSIFFEYFENAISLHREAELRPQSYMETLNYYQFNNYIFSFREKAEEIKTAIHEAFHSTYQNLRSMGLVFGGVIVGIVVGCLLFSLSRLWKVTNGFKELVSILIQIDNSDLRDISKYVDYTRYLFDHLNEKNQRMGLQADSQYSSTSGNFRSFEKRSSEVTDQEQRFASSAANLNKRIKKIEIGNEITKMIVKPAAILLSTITAIGAIILTLNIYATTSLDSFAAFSQLGFTFMETNGINNIIASGTIEKYRGSVLYNYSKYESYLKKSSEIQSSNANLKLTIGSSAFEQNLRTLYYDNFCRSMSFIFNQTVTYEIGTICDGTNAVWCEYLYDDILESNLIKRCETIQSAQLMKGTENYNNFFLKQVLPFFSDIANITLQNLVEINDANKLIDYIMFAIMQQWTDDSGTTLNTRSSNIIIIVVCVFLSTLLLNVICIELLVKRTLKEKYQIFRLMHEHYIPEWIIVKEKIIKVKLIKEGFMKE